MTFLFLRKGTFLFLFNKLILPLLKDRQKDILLLLYRFRFLKRSQIQTLLKHKQFNRIIIWLNDLTEKQYVRRYYDQKFAPDISVYSLGNTARSYFRQNPDKKIHTALLDRVWREHKYSQAFRNHWVFLADIYISLLSLAGKTGATLKFFTQVDLCKMRYLIDPAPDAFFSITEKAGSTQRYFLDIFDLYVHRAEMQKRFRQYFHYYEKRDWQDHNENPFPLIIFIAPNDWAKGYLGRNIKKLLKQKEDNLQFYLSTWGEIKARGITKETLHKIEI